MRDLALTLDCRPGDRTQALRDSKGKPDGITLTCIALEPAEIFYRVINYREFVTSEIARWGEVVRKAGIAGTEHAQ